LRDDHLSQALYSQAWASTTFDVRQGARCAFFSVGFAFRIAADGY
jgi:hypothetical protein